MRLAQLARKLSITQSEVVNFLAAQNITIPDASNIRIEDEHLKLVLQHFAPELKEDTFVQTDEDDLNESRLEIAAPTMGVSTNDETQSPSEQVPTEVIKAPKIELQGLKVLGKIDLPEPKKKEPSEQKVESRPARERREKKSFERRDKRNPIATQREMQEREAERVREEKLKVEKELKTKRYLNKIKQQPTKPTRLVKEEVEHLTEVEEQKPTSLMGRFWRWLRT